MNVWLAGLLVLISTLGGVFAGTRWKASAKPDGEPAKADVQYISGPQVTVPVVGGGAVEGYLMAKFGYRLDKSKLKQTDAALQPLLNDEAFRTLYGVEASRFKKPRPSDLADIASGLTAGINKRLDAEAVKDVMIEELSFIPKEKTRSGVGRQ